MPSRRHVLLGTAALFVPRLARGADAVVEIAMAGRGDGAHVWFDPVGLLVRPGQAVRWTNREEGNVHTATAYHPDSWPHTCALYYGGVSPVAPATSEGAIYCN